MNGRCERRVDCCSWKSLKEDTNMEKRRRWEGDRWVMGIAGHDRV